MTSASTSDHTTAAPADPWLHVLGMLRGELQSTPATWPAHCTRRPKLDGWPTLDRRPACKRADVQLDCST